METQKIVNLLNDSSNYPATFATKNGIIDSELKGNYAKENPIKFITNSIESSLCNYSDAFILVTGDITVIGHNVNAKVAFKNCRTNVADYICIAMHMYNLIEYSDNHSHISGSLWQFKRVEIDNDADVTTDGRSSFKYKSDLIVNVEADGTVKNVKIAVLLKYLSSFWRSLEMPLINSKV